MRILMIITSIGSFYINDLLSKSLYSKKDDLDFEKPLTNLVWITSVMSILVTFVASYFLVGPSTTVGALDANPVSYTHLDVDKRQHRSLHLTLWLVAKAAPVESVPLCNRRITLVARR